MRESRHRRWKILIKVPLMVGGMVAGLAATGLADTIEMEDLSVEGEVQKPEVLFIFDRTGGEPPIPGAERLRENLLDSIVEDAWRMATERKDRDFLR